MCRHDDINATRFLIDEFHYILGISLQEKLAKFSAAEEKKKKDLQARYDREILAAREKEEDANREAEEASSQKQQLEKRMAEVQAQAREAAKVARKAKALETALTAAAREGRR